MPSKEMHAYADLAKSLLAQRKGEFWSRKVVYAVGMKAIGPTVDASCREQFNKLFIADIAYSLSHEYPGRTVEEIQKEFIADCNEFEDSLLDEAETLGELPSRK